METNDLLFKPEETSFTEDPGKSGECLWKLLIVDDEPDIHRTTKFVLKDFQFDGAGLEFISAFSGAEAVELMRSNGDIAVVLLDVVMETSHAGLDCAREIRETLKNRMVRIILRTGQPGEAPERRVIIDYDINDYKHKTELTAQRLFTAVYTGIRSYRDMVSIEKNRQGLKYIIEASGDFFKQQSVKKLAKGVLTQIAALFRLQNSFFLSSQGFTLTRDAEGELELIAATGQYEKGREDEILFRITPELKDQLSRVTEEKKSAYFGDDYIGYFPTQTDKHHILYMENCGREQSQNYRDLLDLFAYNVGVAFDNTYLNREVLNTQQEVIHLLGEIVENRSKETAFHVVRVAEIIGVLGEAVGLPPGERELIKSASPMHDVGKIAIPDVILLKPGRLTPEEIEIMKSHTVIGFKILSSSNRKLLKTAATIAHSHHERWDGNGYPLGLKEDAIPLAGRLTCIADVFDALSSSRVYKPAWSMERVLDFLKENRGSIFDPNLVDVFMENKERIYKIREQYTAEACPA
ncbi:response regulator [Desulfospira joergensenii]|uniref:response regulator n=1 Tax=Desulfospira joergensenii TaxID=53329 RepID=UPI0003B4825F|nr:response regulator [Desulfospira joergensenii]